MKTKNHRSKIRIKKTTLENILKEVGKLLEK